jgi:hypothetical protein
VEFSAERLVAERFLIWSALRAPTWVDDSSPTSVVVRLFS